MVEPKTAMENLNLDKHISKQFNVDLEDIKTAMLTMGGLVEKQLEDSIASVINADSKLAEHVILTENKIDEMEKEIDETCITFIPRRQPTATDLR